ncbi:MAG: homoserine dehydrogenase, partial [Candidatus Omnitrophota bacterium]
LAGVDIELVRICDKDIRSDRGFKVERKLLTTDPAKVLYDPAIDIVIELIGGVHPAKEIVMHALKNRKHVVTANKALLAHEGAQIFAAAAKAGRSVFFEASVGGGIPIIKALREGLVANKIEEIYGIINGTCNYILSRMSDEGCALPEVLKEAQRLGYAEADPTLDITGADTAHKLAVLCGLSFSVLPSAEQIYCEGITAIEPCDIQYGKEMGYAIKLLAIAKRSGERLEIRVHPTLIPKTHLLANVKDVYNAVYVKGDLTGETLFYGKGAGRLPTASAVIADVVDLAKMLARETGNSPASDSIPSAESIPVIQKMSRVRSRYYLRFTTLDQPGVLARIAGILGKHGISIASVTQKEERGGRAVPIVIMTHTAEESGLRHALASIDRLAVIKKKTAYIRMEPL